MKIRTDFVTNSSSSSFVAATIKTTDADLLKAMAKVRYAKVSNGVISIEHGELDCGFIEEGGSVSGVIECLLYLLDSNECESLSKKKEAMADSIEEFKIECGGGCSPDEPLYESLDGWKDYIDHITEKTGLSAEDVWDIIGNHPDYNGWLEVNIRHTFTKGAPVKTTRTYEGPFDGENPFEELSVEEDVD